ncbi:dnaJ homolog subfamily C member 25 isoform X2 [Bemisia tabaci]|uniref:dnaJ homolog subfamily C member 25 isoform X2 n=1 Tax=Bemisia tabaci TaxID=7038 RepID=UPI003B2824CC
MQFWYEILKEEESRTDYDYMLDHPEEVYSHYYRYYRRRVAPKVDVRIVIIVTLIVITVIQYFTSWQRYNTALNYLMTLPKYRNKAIEIALEQGLIDDPRRKVKGKSKIDVKEETDRAIKSILESNLDIRGGYAKPELTDLLILQLILLPCRAFKYFKWYTRWIWRFNINHEEYGDEEKLYLIRKNMKLSINQFDDLEENDKQQFLKNELWVKDKFEKWQKEKNEEVKKQMAENARFKAYRRYMKNHGPGRMVFDDS